MSKYKGYFERANSLALENFTLYRGAVEALKNAESKKNRNPMKQDVNGAYPLEALQAEKEYTEAREGLQRAKETLLNSVKGLSEIRSELSTAINNDYGAMPDQVEMTTVELLKSGIMNGYDYSRLMTKAMENQNYTMVRIIGKYAEKASEDAPTKEMELALRNVANLSRKADGAEYERAFDVVSDTYSRTVKNPAMIPHWEELTGEIIKNI